MIIEKITSVAFQVYSRALQRHIINEIEKSFAALTGGRSRQDRLSNDLERKAATAEAGLLHVIGVWQAPYGAIPNPRDTVGAAKAIATIELSREYSDGDLSAAAPSDSKDERADITS